jgi:hypothetical protein
MQALEKVEALSEEVESIRNKELESVPNKEDQVNTK